MNHTSISNDEALDAVAARDRRYDGVFVYAVTSTGIYCRPSCPSRRPAREHVVIYPRPEDAEENGFRACRRCHPSEATAPYHDAVEHARRYLEEHPDQSVSLDELGRRVGLSPYHLQRSFKRQIGMSPRQYRASVLAERFKRSARRSANVLEGAYDAGYGSPRALYDDAGRTLGMTPGRYRRGGKGVSITYGIATTRLGRLLVAKTEKGICAAALAETDEGLLAELSREFPNAQLERDDEALRESLDALGRYIEGSSLSISTPLDLAGTEFQRRVWEALRAIPYGATRTYSELAESIGQPSATRAVASACANNRIALVIPCHRVIAKDGSVAGYRWGKERKREILEMEKRGMGDRPAEA